MKKTFFSVALLAGFLLLFTPQVRAQANFSLFATNITASLTTNAATAAAVVRIDPEHRGKALTIVPSYSLANTNNENTTFGFNVSLDGQLWTTSVPITATIANSRTGTNMVGFATLDTNVTFHARFIRLDKIVASTNATQIVRVQYRFAP